MRVRLARIQGHDHSGQNDHHQFQSSVFRWLMAFSVLSTATWANIPIDCYQGALFNAALIDTSGSTKNQERKGGI